MKASVLLSLFVVLTSVTGCRDRNTLERDTSDATVASETGGQQFPADVITVTKPLINGEVYNRPSFDGSTVARFDTAQIIQVLDTTDALFIRARILQNREQHTGYVSKAILPE
jgi:hypothetical protein